MGGRFGRCVCEVGGKRDITILLKDKELKNKEEILKYMRDKMRRSPKLIRFFKRKEYSKCEKTVL